MATKSIQETDELNPKWAKFTELYIESGNAYKSAKQAGFSENYALVITTRFPEKVRKSLKEALIGKGITPDKIADKVNELLDAKKGEHPDFNAIDKGIGHASKIYGVLNEDERPKGNTTYNIIFAPQMQEKIKAMDNEIKSLLIQNVQQSKENLETK